MPSWHCSRMSRASVAAASALATSVLPTPASPSSSSGCSSVAARYTAIDSASSARYCSSASASVTAATEAKRASGMLDSLAQHCQRLTHPPRARLLALGLGDPLRVLLAVGEGQTFVGSAGGVVARQRGGQGRGDIDLARLVVALDRDLHSVAGRRPGSVARFP